MPVVRELSADETSLAHPAMSELRPAFTSVSEFTLRVNQVQRSEGYRLLGSFNDVDNDAVAAAGFRAGHNLAWGHYVYVDDLVTCAAHRGQGHADALMGWLFEEAVQMGCDQLHLDSGTHRLEAHRFYFKHDLTISSFHFTSGSLKGKR